MYSRALMRTRVTGATRSAARQVRLQSTTAAPASSTSPLAAGVAGGVASAAILYGIYYVSPAGKASRTINSAAKTANDKYQAAAKKLQESSPTADQAIDSIKQFAYSYVGWVPGGRQYVDAAFKDIDTVRQSRAEEADKLVSDAYKQLQDVAKAGLSLEALHRAYDVVTDLAQKTAALAGNAFTDILDNHPEAKKQIGANVDQLKQLGDRYGPDAKKEVDQTWQQLKDLMAGGFTAANLDKARKVIEEKVEKLKKLGDEAWAKGLEEAKPLLDKNPKVKELVEKNADALKQGNAKELFDRARAAVQSGDLSDLEKYVSGAADKIKEKGNQLTGGKFDLGQYTKLIPEGDKILPKLQQLGEVASKHKDEGQKLLKETVAELQQVLEKRGKQAEEIAEKAKKDAK